MLFKCEVLILRLQLYGLFLYSCVRPDDGLTWPKHVADCEFIGVRLRVQTQGMYHVRLLKVTCHVIGMLHVFM